MNYARENAAWAGCGGPLVADKTFREDGWTIYSDRSARVHVAPVKAGDYRKRGELWFSTKEAALARAEEINR